MPYKSESQRRFFHTKTAQKSGISKAQVKEFDEASRGLKLPQHVSNRLKDHLRRRAGRKAR